jgi:hypothetical protein
MMKILQVLALSILITSVAMGYKSARVCRSDGNTPLELADPCVPWVYRDIMVETHLTIIVSSPDDGLWEYGELSIWGTDRDYGVLSGRDYNEGPPPNWEGSIFPAAGEEALVQDSPESDVFRFTFYAGHDAVDGNWFIIDYNAINVGSCQVAFFDGDFSWDEPLYWMLFTHVPSRDFNQDGIVNFADFAFFGLFWGIPNCADPNGCGKADFDGDQIIGINDLSMFVEYWLERTYYSN